jgi:hypothetical protein
MQHTYRQQSGPPISREKPVLEMVQLPVFRVRLRHLEDFLRKVYRLEGFDFLAATGGVAGATYEYSVQAALPPGPNALRRADAIRRGQRTQNVPLILNVLCLDGYVPAGRYLIDTRPEASAIHQYRNLLQATGDPLAAVCLAFKEAHRREKLFTQQAARMDKSIIEMRKDGRK